MKAVKVKQHPEQPIAAEIMAQAIISISDATTALLSAGLKQYTIVALIHDETKIAKRDINLVLNSLRDLRKQWCTR